MMTDLKLETDDQLRARVEAGHQMIHDLCRQNRRWVMSVPVREDYDPDTVLGNALRSAMLLVERAKGGTRDPKTEDEPMEARSRA